MWLTNHIEPGGAVLLSGRLDTLSCYLIPTFASPRCYEPVPRGSALVLCQLSIHVAPAPPNLLNLCLDMAVFRSPLWWGTRIFSSITANISQRMKSVHFMYSQEIIDRGTLLCNMYYSCAVTIAHLFVYSQLRIIISVNLVLSVNPPGKLSSSSAWSLRRLVLANHTLYGGSHLGLTYVDYV